MGDEVINSFMQGGKVILHHIPDKFRVDIEITMCNVVTHTLNFSPRYFGTMKEQLCIRPLIDTAETFTDGFDKHAISR